MTKDLLFETETCGRCGGTGHYSYNQINGTVCFGCHGHKVRLTKRGAAAQAWLHKQQTVPANQLKVGDRVWAENFFGGYYAWFRVERIEGDTVELAYQRKHKPEPDRMTLHGTETFRVRPAEAFARRWQQMVGLAYQATLTKTGRPRKRAG
jgi:hypothetical protein